MSKERQLLHAWLCITSRIVDPMYETLIKKTKELLAEPIEQTPPDYSDLLKHIKCEGCDE